MKKPVQIETTPGFDPVLNREDFEHWKNIQLIKLMTVAELKTQAMLLEGLPEGRFIFLRRYNHDLRTMEVVTVEFNDLFNQVFITSSECKNILKTDTVIEELVTDLAWLRQYGLVTNIRDTMLDLPKWEAVPININRQTNKAQWKNERKPFSKRK